MKQFHDIIKPLMAIMTLLFGFAYLLIMLLTGKESVEGALIAIVAILKEPYGYYYGSNSGNAKKDETIQNLTQNETTEKTK